MPRANRHHVDRIPNALEVVLLQLQPAREKVGGGEGIEGRRADGVQGGVGGVRTVCKAEWEAGLGSGDGRRS
eukprot:359193-Chlamydomonas_euryale.AAC.2